MTSEKSGAPRRFYFWAWVVLGFFTNLGLADPPNIIVIMTDDMGFSDLGCYGSEIKTPYLDQLAKEGIRFSQFYNTGRCCPTRASLMTGLYQHQAGVGEMTSDKGPRFPGYRGRLMDNCVTLAEVLGPAGYVCIQTGKWHLGDKKKEWWPTNRGFDNVFGCPQGGGFYFRPSSFNQPRQVVRGDKVVYSPKIDPPKGWYATDAYTDEGLVYVKEAVENNKPFFWYLAYNAPHFPLQAKPEDIAKYRGKYTQGWDKLRQARYQRLIDLGLIEKDWKLSPREKGIPAWESLSAQQKDTQDLRMATYAAMIDCVDQNVGKIVDQLKKWKAYENTLILFLHDNGGCHQGGTLGKNTGKGECGTANSFAFYGACWANASNTPFRRYKQWNHEGGIATPLIAHWPAGISAKAKGGIARDPSHLIDIMATCVDITGAKYPETYKGKKITPMEGTTLRPIFQGGSLDNARALYFEHLGNRAVRQGDWKLVAERRGPWELYHMKVDRTELNNLAKKNPDKVQELKNLYTAWAKRCLVEKKK